MVRDLTPIRTLCRRSLLTSGDGYTAVAAMAETLFIVHLMLGIEPTQNARRAVGAIEIKADLAGLR